MTQLEKSRKKQFEDALEHMDAMIKKLVIRVEDAQYLLKTGVKLLLQYEKVFDSRAKWRTRAETAEAKLKK